jgi:hypothetical protein
MLRMRSRKLIVSSLLLWIDQRTTDTGGRVWQKIRTPLAFFVELLVLLLLVLAAANPLWPREGTLPIVVVLDNSYSMQAVHKDDDSQTTQDLARRRLATLLENESLNAQIVLAGRHPLLLSERFNTAKSLDQLEPYWKCIEPAADLDAAITLARQVGGLGTRVLVITDQVSQEKVKPDDETINLTPDQETTEDTKTPEADSKEKETTEKKPDEKKEPQKTEPTLQEQVRWVSVGRDLPNLAIVSAVRRDAANENGQGRAIVEVANLSHNPITSQMFVRLGERQLDQPLSVKPGEIHRFTVPITNSHDDLELTLPTDALELDNRAILLPESVAQIRAKVSVKDKDLRKDLLRALRATGRVKIVENHPQIRFSDTRLKPRNGCWDVFLLSEKDQESILGPFVLEKTSELLEGVTLKGIVMCQSKKLAMPGRPLVASDSATLVSLDILPDESQRLYLQYSPGKTTLLDSVDFPILVWNLLRWREGGLPERCRSNVRLGEAIRLRLKKGRQHVEQVTPAKNIVPLKIFDDAAIFTCDTPGRYEIVLDKGTNVAHQLPLSSNILFRDESDLRGHYSGEWGKWKVTDATRSDYFGVIIPLLLIALLLWVLHGRIIRSKE